MSADATHILTILQEKAADTSDPDVLGDAMIEALSDAFEKASWVGIYWLRGTELVLGPYRGPDTDHQTITVGVGVCGTAIEKDEDQIIADVRELDNYLACSPTVRSELVVLIRSRGEVIGQVDMDADTVGAFDQTDHSVVRAVADSFGGLVEPKPVDTATHERQTGQLPSNGDVPSNGDLPSNGDDEDASES